MLQHNPIKADDSMEALKTAVTCIIAAVVYGIVHDQFTAESVLNTHDFHPPLFPTQSPTLLGHRMGIIATWWVAAFFAESTIRRA